LRRYRDQRGTKRAHVPGDLGKRLEVYPAKSAPVPPIKADDDRTALKQVVKAYDATGAVRQLEIRCCFASLERLAPFSRRAEVSCLGLQLNEPSGSSRATLLRRDAICNLKDIRRPLPHRCVSRHFLMTP
jgi:hypothetical protein